jgi:hypothetical protein
LRYFALILQGRNKSVVLFPDFPDLVSTGRVVEEALRTARRELLQRVAMLRWLGATISPPMDAKAIRSSPYYAYATVAIITLPDPPQPPQAGRTLARLGRV